MNSFLLTTLAVLAGLCLYAAVSHRQVELRRPPDRTHALFAVLCFLVAGYVLAKIGAYRSPLMYTLGDPRRVKMIGRSPWAWLSFRRRSGVGVP